MFGLQPLPPDERVRHFQLVELQKAYPLGAETNPVGIAVGQKIGERPHTTLRGG